MELPSFYLVNGRPVKLVATEDGGMDVQALNLKTGEFERELSYLSRVILSDSDTDQVDQATFEERVAQVQNTKTG